MTKKDKNKNLIKEWKNRMYEKDDRIYLII